MYSPSGLDTCVPIHVPTLALDECCAQRKTPVIGIELEAHLEDAAVFKNVLIVLSVNNGDPIFCMH